MHTDQGEGFGVFQITDFDQRPIHQVHPFDGAGLGVAQRQLGTGAGHEGLQAVGRFIIQLNGTGDDPTAGTARIGSRHLDHELVLARIRQIGGERRVGGELHINLIIPSYPQAACPAALGKVLSHILVAHHPVAVITDTVAAPTGDGTHVVGFVIAEGDVPVKSTMKIVELGVDIGGKHLHLTRQHAEKEFRRGVRGA